MPLCRPGPVLTLILFLAGLASAQTHLRILGDSVSAGFGASDPSLRYTTLLAESLGVDEINPSISGGTLTEKSYVAHMFDYWESTFLHGDPDDYALVFLGINDTGWIQNHPAQGAVFAERLQTIVAGLLEFGYRPSRIILCAPYYFGGLEPARTTVWNAYADTADTYGVVFADFWAHAGSWGWKSGYLPDGTHPNDAGHQHLHDWVLEALDAHSGGPTVHLASPADGSTYLVGASVEFEATATGAEGIAEVRFLLDETLLFTATSIPFRYQWTATEPGDHALHVVAEDTHGQTDEDTITLSIVGNYPPEVSITEPGADTTLFAGTALSVAAEASDSDGTITRVEFLLDGHVMASVPSAPFEILLADLAVGEHVLIARATDDAENTAESDSRLITILPSPTADVVAAINCGSQTDFVDGYGQGYLADTHVSGGSMRYKEQEIDATDDDELYYTYRVGTFQYGIPVADGLYDVTLRVIEPYWNGTGQRVFSVDAEGERTITDLDLFAQYGCLRAVDLIIPGVVVEDGVLDLAFVPSSDGAVVNAILVREVNPPPTPLETWMENEFGSASIDLSSDEDRDGIPLLWEYALDLDPHQFDDRSGLLKASNASPFTVSFCRDPLKWDIHYILETSPDFENWTTRFGASDGDLPNNQGTEHAVDLDTLTPPLFIRLRIEWAE